MINVAAVDHTIHSIQSFLPWDIPWNSETAVFFGVTYGVIVVIVLGLAYTALMTLKDLKKGGHH